MAIPVVEFSREGYQIVWLNMNCSQMKLPNLENWSSGELFNLPFFWFSAGKSASKWIQAVLLFWNRIFHPMRCKQITSNCFHIRLFYWSIHTCGKILVQNPLKFSSSKLFWMTWHCTQRCVLPVSFPVDLLLP